LRLTSRHNLSALVTCHTLYVVFTTWQSAVFLVNSRLTHFTATGSISATLFLSTDAGDSNCRCWIEGLAASQPNLFTESPKWSRHPFFRSYGARLPSSLTRFHSRALAKFCPPTCVGFRYGQPWEHPEVFLGSCFNGSALAEASTSLLLRADRHFQSATHLYRNVTSELNHSRCRNIKPAVHRLRPSAST
jgi:hypothetical protein